MVQDNILITCVRVENLRDGYNLLVSRPEGERERQVEKADSTY